MPKRTNDFQTLVKTIYEQIMPEGGTVAESGMVLDKEAGILREVDVLVTYKYAGHEFTFVVECRDRSRSETVEWIDSLIGKIKPLDVNKVIAVSSKGFASTAERKAKENGIETLTLQEANETNWVNFPFKPGLVLMTDDIYRVKDVLYQQSEEYISIATLGLESQVEINGEAVGDLRGLIEYFFQNRLIPQIRKHKNDHFPEIFKTRADVCKPMLVQSDHDWSGIRVITQDGSRIELKKSEIRSHR